jgi:predicted GNAT family acetyltransferase
MTEPTVVNATDRSRYELAVDGEVVSVADYELRDHDIVVFPHTETVPAHRGKGFAEVLVRAALDDVRRHRRTVIPACWFVANLIDHDPRYHDLLASGT